MNDSVDDRNRGLGNPGQHFHAPKRNNAMILGDSHDHLERGSLKVPQCQVRNLLRGCPEDRVILFLNFADQIGNHT